MAVDGISNEAKFIMPSVCVDF